jgi:hypothetical protein
MPLGPLDYYHLTRLMELYQSLQSTPKSHVIWVTS